MYSSLPYPDSDAKPYPIVYPDIQTEVQTHPSRTFLGFEHFTQGLEADFSTSLGLNLPQNKDPINIQPPPAQNQPISSINPTRPPPPRLEQIITSTQSEQTLHYNDAKIVIFNYSFQNLTI